MLNVANVLLHIHTTAPSRCSTHATPQHAATLPQLRHGICRLSSTSPSSRIGSPTTPAPPSTPSSPSIPSSTSTATTPGAQDLVRHPPLNTTKALSLDAYVPDSAQTIQLKVVRGSPPQPAGHLSLDYALTGISDDPLVGGLTVAADTLTTKGTVQGTSSSTPSWTALSRKARHCASASRLCSARSPRRQQWTSATRRSAASPASRRIRGRRRRERPREDHRRRVIAFGVLFPVIGQPDYKGWNYTCKFYC